MQTIASVSVSGTYEIIASLADEAGNVLLTKPTRRVLPSGVTTITLEFEARQVRELGFANSYRLAALEASIVTAEEIRETDGLNNLNVVPALNVSIYQLGREFIETYGSPLSLGTLPDGNGKHQLLQVRIPVDVAGSGTFSYSAVLRTLDGKPVAWTQSRSFMSLVAIEQLTFYFDGGQIAASGLNGPYLITDFIIQDLATRQVLVYLPTAGQTAVFQATQFAACSAPYSVKLLQDEGTGVYCGSLSYAIEKAKTANQSVTISTAGVDILTLRGTLPSVGNNNGFTVTLDGGCNTEGGWKVPATSIYGVLGSRQTGIILNNRVVLNGFRFFAFDQAQVVLAGSDNLLTCNWIGTYDGLDVASGTGNGVVIGVVGGPSANNNRLGLAGVPDSGNLISGNGKVGLLVINGKNNSLHYSRIGLRYNSNISFPNVGGGVKILSGGQLKSGLANRISQ